MIIINYIYGPVPSRRLGRSLGCDPIPSKTCNFQCIYCQLGRTNNFTNKRKSYFPKDEIIAEMEEAIKANEKKFDYITFVGSGEPTLCRDLKELLNIIERHPMRQDQLINTFYSESFTKNDILNQLKEFESENLIKKSMYNTKIFWRLL